MIKVQIQQDGQSALFHLDGNFDAAKASLLREQVASLGSDALVTVDFSRVKHFDDSALGQLADALGQADARVDVRGLRHHQQRLLAYFGMVAPAVAAPSIDERS